MTKQLKVKRLNIHNIQVGSNDPSDNIAEQVKEIKTVLVVTPEDFNIIDLMLDFRKYRRCEPCPFPLKTLDDFISVMVRCVNLGSDSATVNRRFNDIMIALSLTWAGFRQYKLSYKKRQYYSETIKPSTVEKHYECAMDILTRRLKNIAVKGSLFTEIFLRELRFKTFATVGQTAYLSHIYGAIFDKDPNDLSSNVRDFFYGVENYVVVESSFKTEAMTYEYIKQLKEVEIAKARYALSIQLLNDTNLLDLTVRASEEKDKKILELINLWEEDQRIKEKTQLELSHLRKLSHQKDIMIGRLEEKAYKVIEERDNSEAKYTLLETQFLQTAENNRILEEENQQLKRQLADFQKREEEKANEEKK